MAWCRYRCKLNNWGWRGIQDSALQDALGCSNWKALLQTPECGLEGCRAAGSLLPGETHALACRVQPLCRCGRVQGCGMAAC